MLISMDLSAIEINAYVKLIRIGGKKQCANFLKTFAKNKVKMFFNEIYITC